MPTVKPNESESEFVARCIPVVLADQTAKDTKQAVAVCFAMYKQQTSEKALTKRVGNDDLPSGAFLVVEDPEAVTTWHLPVKKYDGANLVADHARMGAAWAALHDGYRGNVYEGPGKQDAVAKLRKLYESEGLDIPEKKSFSSVFSTYKGFDGNPRWITVSSNSYQDREGQYVSQKALEADVARSDRDESKDFGPLRWWHVGNYDLITQKATDGLDIGDCDFRMMHGKFLVESGTFRSKELADAFEGFDGRVSIRFLHPPNEPDLDGVFHNIHIFERSILPTGKEANLFTSFQNIGVTQMNEKVKQFKQIVTDPALSDELLSFLDTYQKELDQRVSSKDETSETENGARELVAKVKALLKISEKEETQPEVKQETKPETQTLTNDGIAAAVTAGVTAAMQGIMEAQQKSALEVDTEKSQQAQITALVDRFSKLEGDLSDAISELSSTKKELNELIGEGGFRASESDETLISDAKKESLKYDGLQDFASHLAGNA